MKGHFRLHPSTGKFGKEARGRAADANVDREATATDPHDERAADTQVQKTQHTDTLPAYVTRIRLWSTGSRRMREKQAAERQMGTRIRKANKRNNKPKK